ncbi:hypothetical protein [Limnobacter sp.]|uniref:hypothetical protein n=1 Tax=Limnobacter sp. TaxID=2003368 RepID=UPI0035139F01
MPFLLNAAGASRVVSGSVKKKPPGIQAWRFWDLFAWCFLGTTLFRRLPVPGKEAKKCIKRVREKRVHLFNVIKSWPLCKRVDRNINKLALAVVCITLNSKELCEFAAHVGARVF